MSGDQVSFTTSQPPSNVTYFVGSPTNALLNQEVADQQVIQSLLKTVRELSDCLASMLESDHKQCNRSNDMIIRSTDGNVYRVKGEVETLTQEQIDSEAQRLQAELAVLQPAPVATGATTPTDSAPADQSTPTDQPAAPADPAQATPT